MCCGLMVSLSKVYETCMVFSLYNEYSEFCESTDVVIDQTANSNMQAMYTMFGIPQPSWWLLFVAQLQVNNTLDHLVPPPTDTSF